MDQHETNHLPFWWHEKNKIVVRIHAIVCECVRISLCIDPMIGSNAKLHSHTENNFDESAILDKKFKRAKFYKAFNTLWMWPTRFDIQSMDAINLMSFCSSAWMDMNPSSAVCDFDWCAAIWAVLSLLVHPIAQLFVCACACVRNYLAVGGFVDIQFFLF